MSGSLTDGDYRVLTMVINTVLYSLTSIGTANSPTSENHSLCCLSATTSLCSILTDGNYRVLLPMIFVDYNRAPHSLTSV